MTADALQCKRGIASVVFFLTAASNLCLVVSGFVERMCSVPKTPPPPSDLCVYCGARDDSYKPKTPCEQCDAPPIWVGVDKLIPAMLLTGEACPLTAYRMAMPSSGDDCDDGHGVGQRHVLHDSEILEAIGIPDCLYYSTFSASDTLDDSIRKLEQIASYHR